MTQSEQSPLVQQVERFKAAAARREAAELERLVEAYTTVYKRTTDEVDAFLLKLKEQADKGEPITENQVRKMARYKELLEEIETEVDKYAGFVNVEMSTAARAAIEAGQKDALKLVELSTGGQVTTAELRALNPEVIEQLVGFLDKDGELWKRLDGLGKWTSQQVADAIIGGVGLGQNPRTIASAITKSMGMGLTASMTTARTVQLWSYREANRAIYNANADVVQGWVWLASLDDACIACVAMHGTEHELDEVLDDHFNGRCSMAPRSRLYGNPVDQTGEEWFNELPEDQQRAMMGEEKWQAWKDGEFDFGGLAATHTDEVYGMMRGEETLKKLKEGESIFIGPSVDKARRAETGQEFSTTLYRGTGTDPSEARRNRTPSQYGVGEYWSPSRVVAHTYGPDVRAERITLANPYVFSLSQKRAYFDDLKKEFGTSDPNKITDLLKERGHDGLIVKGVTFNRGGYAAKDTVEIIRFK